MIVYIIPNLCRRTHTQTYKDNSLNINFKMLSTLYAKMFFQKVTFYSSLKCHLYLEGQVVYFLKNTELAAYFLLTATYYRKGQQI